MQTKGVGLKVQTRLKLKPGQPGAKKLTAEYGDRLVCVRYRYDEQQKKRFKTVELIVEETAWSPKQRRFGDDAIVSVRVGWQEKELQGQVKRAGGRWNPDKRL
jgi:hypothetical protein